MRTWTGLLLLALLVIYLPDLGHGFIKDDFVWIASNQAGGLEDLLRPFTHAPDFYRPLVSLSFAANWWLFGAEPLGYGLTNLVLLLAAAAVLRSLALALGLPRGAALACCALWTLNFHGIGMALLWISGRTSLLATLFSLLAARAFIRGSGAWAAGWVLLALLSKEEAALLPFVLLAWAALGPAGANDSARQGIDIRRALRRTWPLFVVLAVYLALRTAAGGMTPATAPAAYQFTYDPAAVGRNALEYLDRSATLSAAALLVLGLAAGALPRPTPQQKHLAALGGAWMVGHLGLALLLPVRSSLYAVGPSAGAALAGAALLAAAWQRATSGGRRRMLGAAVAVTLLTVPVHWSRNERWVAPAELSAHVLDVLAPVAAALPPDAVVQLDDDRGSRANLDACFGTLVETAVRLRTGLDRRVWIEPPVVDWEAGGLVAPEPQDVAARFALRGGVLARAAADP